MCRQPKEEDNNIVSMIGHCVNVSFGHAIDLGGDSPIMSIVLGMVVASICPIRAVQRGRHDTYREARSWISNSPVKLC